MAFCTPLFICFVVANCLHAIMAQDNLTSHHPDITTTADNDYSSSTTESSIEEMTTENSFYTTTGSRSPIIFTTTTNYNVTDYQTTTQNPETSSSSSDFSTIESSTEITTSTMNTDVDVEATSDSSIASTTGASIFPYSVSHNIQLTSVIPTVTNIQSEVTSQYTTATDSNLKITTAVPGSTISKQTDSHTTEFTSVQDEHTSQQSTTPLPQEHTTTKTNEFSTSTTQIFTDSGVTKTINPSIMPTVTTQNPVSFSISTSPVRVESSTESESALERNVTTVLPPITDHKKRERKVKSLDSVSERENDSINATVTTTITPIKTSLPILETTVKPPAESIVTEIVTNTLRPSVSSIPTKELNISTETQENTTDLTQITTQQPFNDTTSIQLLEVVNTTDEITEFLLNFEGKCNESPSKAKFLYTNFVKDRDVVSGTFSCKRLVQLRFLYHEGSDLSDSESTLEALKHLIGKLELPIDNGYVLKLSHVFGVSGIDVSDSNGTNSSGTIHYLAGLSYSEFVSYVVIGCCFGCLILFAFILLCAKCCQAERKRSQLHDVPEITLRLEDYNLTRIPRPTTIYNTADNSKYPDNASTASGPRGRLDNDSVRMSCAYDTAIIPLDDYDTDTRRYTTAHRYPQNGGELRTFRSRNSAATARPQSVNTNEGLSKTHSLSNSTERLTQEFYMRKRDPGLENPIYH